MSATVGSIYLNLEITKNISEQLKAIASMGEKQAKTAFSGVGEAVAESISKPMQDAGKAVQEAITAPVEAAQKTVSKIVKAVKTETGALYPDEVGGKKSMLASQMVDDPYGQKATQKAEVPKTDVQGFRAATDTVGLLNQELNNVLSRLRLQEKEVDSLTAAYREIPTDKLGSDEAVKLETKLAAAEGRLVSLQKSANKAQAAVDKAMQPAKGDIMAPLEKAAGKAKSAMDGVKNAVGAASNAAAAEAGKAANAAGQKVKEAGKCAGNAAKSGTDKAKQETGKLPKVVGKAMTAVKSKITGAFKQAGNGAGKQVKDIGHKVGGLARSVKSAFKSAFLMAGLYAAFRGIKSLVGDAVKQNKEFSNSLNLIKSNLLVAFTPIMQTIQPALNALAAGFAAVSKQVATVTAGLFGQSYAQAKAATKQMQDVSKAAKKANASLGIDELNVVNQGDNDTGVDLSALDTAKYEDAANFGTTVKKMLSDAAAGVGPILSKITSKIAGYAPKVLAAAAGIITSLLSGLNGHAPEIIAAGMTLLQSLIDGMHSLLPTLGPFVTNVITMLLSGFLLYAPQLFAMGITLLASVLDGLSQKMPELIPMAQQAITTVLGSIRDNLHTIVTAGMSILTSIIKGITDMMPELVPTAIDCILELVDGILDNLPMLLDAAIGLIEALATSLIDELPRLVDKAPEIIGKLVDGLVDAIPKLMDAAINIITGLGDFLTEHGGDMWKTATKIVMKLGEGLIKAIFRIHEGCRKLVTAIKDKIIETDWLQVGKDILAGIGKGLISGVKGIGGAIKDAANGLVDGFKNFFGIHSPSRLFRDQIGENLALGIGEGFVGEMGSVAKSMQNAIPVPELTNIHAKAPANNLTAHHAAVSAAQQAGISQDVIQLLERIAWLLERLFGVVDAMELVVQVVLEDRQIAQAANRGNKSMGYAIAR